MGWTVQDRKGPKQDDVCPYLNLDNIDPKWYVSSRVSQDAVLISGRYEANGGDPEVLKAQREAVHADAKG